MPDSSPNDDKNVSPSNAVPVTEKGSVVGQTPADEGSTTGASAPNRIGSNPKLLMKNLIEEVKKLDPAFKSDYMAATNGIKKCRYHHNFSYNKGLCWASLTLTIGPDEPSGSEADFESTARSEFLREKKPASQFSGEATTQALSSTSDASAEKPPGWIESIWPPLVGLGLSTVAVLLLIVLLFRSGSAPAKTPDQPDNAGSVAKEIKNQSAEVTKAIATQTEQVAKLEQVLNKLAASGVTIPQQFASDVARQVVVPKEIGAADVQSFRQDIQNLKTEVKNFSSRAATPPAPPPEYWERLGTEIKTAVGGATPKAASASARDTYIVITHGSAMNANRFIGTLREAMTKYMGRGRDATVRLGLAVASTTELINFVSPSDPTVDLKSFNTPSPDASEAPQLFGRSLKQLFPVDRLTQRSILLVTDQAMAPVVDNPEDMEGWNALSQVDVLVLATRDPKEFKLEDWKKYARWCTFAESRRGSVQLIGHPADERRQNDLLRESLRRLILQAD